MSAIIFEGVCRNTMLCLLGEPRIEAGGRAVPIQGDASRVIFAVLASRPNEAVRVDSLEEALWPDGPPDTARSSLRSHITRLRRRIISAGAEAEIVARQLMTDSAYVLTVDPMDVDHTRFAGLTQGATEQAGSDRYRARQLLAEALDLWKGEPFEGLDLPDLLPMASRLNSARLDAVELACELALADDDHQFAVRSHLQAAIAHPERERLCGLVMTALYRAGRQSEALDLFQSCRSWLAENLGLEPTSSLVELEKDILLHRGAVTARPSESRPPEIPKVLQSVRRGAFVGRGASLAVLEASALDESTPGGTCVVGPAGIGKSRLLAELAAKATAQGHFVAYGWAQPRELRPFGVLLRALDCLVGSPLDPQVNALRSELSRPVRRADLRIRAIELHNAVTQFCSEIRQRGIPAVLALDDLQWADSASSFVLEHLVRECPPALGLLLAGRPPTDLGASPSWIEFVSNLSAFPTLDYLKLGGLSSTEVHEWMASTKMQIGLPSSRVAERLTELTGGNPFLMRTVAQELSDRTVVDPLSAWARTGSQGIAPADPVAARVARLPDEICESLQVAAVIGFEFRIDRCAEVARRVYGRAFQGIDERRTGGAITPAGTAPGVYHFEHDLLRTAVLETISSDLLARLNAAAAEVAEESGEDPAVIAGHLLRAVPIVDARRALAWAKDAAEYAFANLSVDEAGSLYHEALGLLRASGVVDADLEIDLEIGAALASRKLGSRDSVIPRLEAAFHKAKELGLNDKMADVALAAAATGDVLQISDPVRSLLAEAAEAGAPDPERRAQVIAEVSIKRVVVEGATPELIELHRSAFLDARPGSRESLLRDRSQLHLLAGAPLASERLELAQSLLRRAAPPDLVWLDAKLFAISALLELGRTQEAVAELDGYEAAVESHQIPACIWLARVARADVAQQSGDFDLSARLVEDALRYGTEYDIPDAVDSHTGHTLVTAYLTNGLAPTPLASDEVQPDNRSVGGPVHMAAAALVLASLGDEGRARRLVHRVVEEMRHSPAWTLKPFTLTLAAEAAIILEAADVAGPLLDELLPYSGTMPRMALVGASMGPVDRQLASLLHLTGNDREARTIAEAALALAEKALAGAWITRCRAVLEDERK